MNYLLCLVHFHSPVGTPQEELEDYYQNICRRVLISFHNHQDLKFSLHISGIFLEWLDDKHPEILMLINDMVKRKQVEILGGPYYEAALSMIPNSDKLGQVEFLTTFLRKKFGKRPRGGIVPHLIWEPSLASSLKNSGFDYTFLSSRDVVAQPRGNEFEPFLTEDQGKSIGVFPVAHELSRMLGHMRPADMVKKFESSKKRVYTIFVDTLQLLDSKTLFEDGGWFDDFLDQLKSAETFLLTKHPRSIMNRYSQLERLYLPCSQPFHYNGDTNTPLDFFRQKLADNPVASNLYGKMIYTYQLVNSIKGDRSRKKTAREELWKGQCNEAFWADNYIQNHILRKSLYASFMEAEKITREKGIFKPSITMTDMNMDSRNEYLYQSQNLNCYINPKYGSIYEIDYLPCLWNYGDTYPCDANEKQLPSSFCDMIIEGIPKKISEVKTEQNYITYNTDLVDRDQKEIQFSSDIELVLKRNSTQTVRILKKYQFKKNTIAIDYIPSMIEKNALTDSLYLTNQLSFSFFQEKGFSLKISKDNGHTEIDILDTAQNVHVGISINAEVNVYHEDCFSNGKTQRYQYTKILMMIPLSDLKQVTYSLKIEKK